MTPRKPLESRVPAARALDLVVTSSDDEVLVYDQTVHHIHHLNTTAAKVWRLCDGERTVREIAVETGMAEDEVKLALRKLEDAQLLDALLETSMRGTQSRRAFMKKAGIAALPAIISITAPIAKAAASGEMIQCQTNDCCLGNCLGPGGDNINNYPAGTWGTCLKKDKPGC